MNPNTLKQCFHNLLCVEEQPCGLVPCRYTPTQRAFYDALDYGQVMGVKARMSAGVTLEFDTDAAEIALCWQVTGSYPAAATNRGSVMDVYINGVLRAQQAVDCPLNAPQQSVFALGAGQKRVEIYLPHTFVFALQDIRLPAGAAFAPVAPRPKRALMLGDSITQGIGAAFSSAGYAMQLARAMGWEALNQSVAAVRFEPDCLEYLGFAPDIITVALGCNDWETRRDQAEYDDFAGRFFKRLNDIYPRTPTLVLSPIKVCRGEPDLPPDRPHMYRESALYQAIRALCVPYPQMRCVDGWLLAPHVTGFFLDGVHPNDLGMTWYANALAPFAREMMGE